MSEQSDLLLDLSILYRSTQKYYDRMLQDSHLTYAQLPILVMIYEKEGISMQGIALQGGYDKGTISKNVKHLQAQGYIKVIESAKDKRNRELYTTDAAKQIMSKVYGIRRDWWRHLIQDIDEDEMDQFIGMYQTMASNAREYADMKPHKIHFFQCEKLNISDYPDKLSTVLSTGGCNFRCPTCQKKDLVFLKEAANDIPLDEIMNHLKKRKNMIQAVCIQGGEPFMHPDIEFFLKEVKKLGYPIKITTNGSFPDLLKDFVKKKLIDYVCMEVKNGPTHYGISAGMGKYDISQVEESKDFLLENKVDYEFMIQLSKEYHSLRDIEELSSWINGAKSVCIYNNIEGKDTIEEGLHSWDEEDVKQAIDILKKHVKHVRVGD